MPQDAEKPKGEKPEGTAGERFVLGRELTKDQLVEAIVHMVNDARIAQGLPPLKNL
jgi:hypothetical protein